VGSRSEQRRREQESSIEDFPTIRVKYTNHRGETRIREIVPIRTVYKKSYFHTGQPEEWVLECWDKEKRAMRDYALKDCNFVNPLMTVEVDPVSGIARGVPAP
jgi:hypothetical protein